MTNIHLRIEAWDRRTCNECRRTRVHYRIKTKWYCIGTLPEEDRISKPCGKADAA